MFLFLFLFFQKYLQNLLFIVKIKQNKTKQAINNNNNNKNSKRAEYIKM